MKKYILLLLSIVLLISCNSNTNDTTVVYNTKDKNCPFNIIIIDSCEYLSGVDGNREFLSHKGNCKFCKQRELDYYD